MGYLASPVYQIQKNYSHGCARFDQKTDPRDLVLKYQKHFKTKEERNSGFSKVVRGRVIVGTN